MFFRESIADRLSPAHRGRGFSLQPSSILKQPRFGVGTLHLDFPSRMYLPRFVGAFLFWPRATRIPASRIDLLEKTADLPRGMSQCAHQPRPSRRRGLWPSQRAEFLNPALGLIAMRWP